MSCHGISQVHGTGGNAAYHFKPRQSYLFEFADNSVLKGLNHLSIKLRPQQHKQDLLAPVLQTSQFCSSCHTQFMDQSMNNWGWVKMQNEYLAWANSKFNQSSDTRFTHPEGKNCQSCHMPKTPATGLAVDESGEVTSHYFVGANMMLAKQFGNHELAELTRQFLQQDKVTVSIVPPEDHQAQQSSLFVTPGSGVGNKPPVALYRGQKTQLTVLVNNHGVGHNFPAGTIDLSEAWLEFTVLDGEQNTLFSSGHLLDDGVIAPGAVVYKETPIDKTGQPVFRHDLFNMVGRSYYNVIPPGETDIVNFTVDIPDWAVSPVVLSATLKFRKLNPQYQQWVAVEEPIVANPVVDVSRDVLRVELRREAAVGVVSSLSRRGG